MAAGLPVVATDIAGVREAIGDASVGLLAPPSDHGALAQAILSVMADGIMALTMGAAGRERIRTEFSPEKMVRETTVWIEEGLRRHGR
jgi:glycosyltransferase involved in cell wall biosynthesis